MATSKVKGKLKGELERFLSGVSEETLNASYDELTALIYQYKGMLDANDIYVMFCDLDKEMNLNDWQEEVIWEVSNRLAGHCRPGKKIIL